MTRLESEVHQAQKDNVNKLAIIGTKDKSIWDLWSELSDRDGSLKVVRSLNDGLRENIEAKKWPSGTTQDAKMGAGAEPQIPHLPAYDELPFSAGILPTADPLSEMRSEVDMWKNKYREGKAYARRLEEVIYHEEGNPDDGGKGVPLPMFVPREPNRAGGGQGNQTPTSNRNNRNMGNHPPGLAPLGLRVNHHLMVMAAVMTAMGKMIFGTTMDDFLIDGIDAGMIQEEMAPMFRFKQYGVN